MNSNFFRKLMSNIRKRSFYIVLMGCVIALTVTAVYVTKARLDYLSENTLVNEDSNYEVSMLDNKEEEENEDSIAEKEGDNEIGSEQNKETLVQLKEPTAPKKQEEVNKQENESIQDKKEIKEKVQKNNNDSNNEKVIEKSQKKFSIENIIMPVEGTIIKEFSIDKLLYSKTLDQWCTHSGIDISSPAGTPVKAVGDGVIDDIYKDDMLGITIIINHGNGYKTQYSNLSSTDMVEKNEIVKEGQIINGIGKTSISEKSEESHLHFEIIHNNENIDPYDYLPISNMH